MADLLAMVSYLTRRGHAKNCPGVDVLDLDFWDKQQ
jgi:hypothetical protein